MKKRYAFPIASLISGIALSIIGAIFWRLYNLEVIGQFLLVIVTPVSAIAIFIKDLLNRPRNKTWGRK